MKKPLKAVAIQTKIPKSKDEGEKQIEKLVKEALKEPVDMIGLPEDCITTWEDINSGYQPFNFLSKIAKENKVYLFGATAVKEENGKIYNAGFLFNKQGKLIARHNKVVLTPTEEEVITAGRSIEVFDTEFGKMAILVCKDSFHKYAAWFFDKLRKAGAEIVLVPSYSLNVSERSIELWVDSLKALAKWFDMYIVASGTIGQNATKYPSFGHALIICPKRVILAEGSFDKEELLRATLDPESLDEIRNTYGKKWQPQGIPKVKVIK